MNLNKYSAISGIFGRLALFMSKYTGNMHGSCKNPCKLICARVVDIYRMRGFMVGKDLYRKTAAELFSSC